MSFDLAVMNIKTPISGGGGLKSMASCAKVTMTYLSRVRGVRRFNQMPGGSQ
jgi:hypothetical protein